MLDIIMIILLLFTIILMLYSIIEKNVALCLITAIMWLILALLIVQGVEIPYQLYNASSTKVITGVQTVQTNLQPLSYLFMGFGVIMFIMFFVFVLEEYIENQKKL